MAEEFRVLRPREYHSQLVLKGRRADGRSLEDSREVKLEVDAIKTADSSSLIKLGNTSLVCGCTTQTIKGQEGFEDGNEVRINVELPPICSSPTGYKTYQTAQLLTRTLKNILTDSDCIEKQNFYSQDLDCHTVVDIEVICLNYDGSLLDAALMAMVAALKGLKLHDRSNEFKDRIITLRTIPVCCSFALLGDCIISDPSLEEETVSQSNFSITIDTNSCSILNVNKTGGKALTTDELFKCINIAKARSEKIRSILNSIIPETKMDCD